LTERSVEYSRAFGRLTVDTGIDVPRSTALILDQHLRIAGDGDFAAGQAVGGDGDSVVVRSEND
jgi:hypothetical protein